VPNRRVRDFVGRESVLAQIDASFNLESDVGPRIVILRAMGGQGKTQIALEYCRRIRHKANTSVFWVDASSENTLKQSYSTMFEILASQADILPDVDARVKFTLRRLRAWRSPWLIVLDNYDNPGDFNNVGDYIPECEQGMVLVTSRHADADGLAKEENQIRLSGLLESEAVKLLLSQGIRQQTDHIASSCAKLIVERLGYHPLAIAQAGAYISKRELPLEDFLDHFQRRKSIILKDTTPQMSQYRRKLEGAERETSLSVFATWELSYQQLLAEDMVNKCMSDLLTLLAFFAPGGVSENFLKAYCDHSATVESPSHDTEASKATHGSQEPYGTYRVGDRNKNQVPGAFLDLHEKTWDSDLYCDALATMSQLSLVEGFSKAPDGTYKATLHPLVRDWIRLRTDNVSCAEYTYLVAICIYRLLRPGLINDHFTMGFSIGQDVLKHLDAHVINVEDFFPQGSDVLDKSKRTCLVEYGLTFGGFYYEFGEYPKAREVYRQCLARLNNEIAINDLVTRRLLGALGEALRRMGVLKEAEDMVKKALHMALEVNGKEHEETLGYMTQLSHVLLDQDLNEEAEEAVYECLGLSEKLRGKEDPVTLHCMSLLGRLLKHQNKHEESKEVYRRTLKLQEVVLGKEHSDTLVTMHNLASVSVWSENWEEEKNLYHQVLDIEEKLHGKEHPRRMVALSNLASILTDMGRYDEAEETYLESVKSIECSLGKDHPYTLSCYREYGRFLRINRRYEEAFPLLERAYRGFCETFGPQHVDNLHCEGQLELLMQDLGNRIEDLVDAGRDG
jgi:tetratricopeptide (TPR) repeat protein